MSSTDLKNYSQYCTAIMDLFEKYDKRTCKLANRIKAKSIDTVKSVQKIETLVELCQRWNCRNGSADNEALSKTAPCSPLGCCAEALEKDCYEHTATGKVCGLRAENSKENITTCIRRKKSSSTSSQQQDKKLNTSDSSTRIPNSSTVISSLATDGQFAFCQTMNRHRKLATIVFRFIMLTTFLLMLHIPMSAGSPITPHLNNLDINVQSFTAADTVANSEYQELQQGTPLAASSKNLNSGEQQQESAAKTYVWPTWLQSPPKETPVLRSRRQERATKRGLPPKYLTRHEFLQRLYSRNYYFLEILRNGKVRGTRNQNSSYSVLRIKSVAVGVLVIYGTKSKKYLAMTKRGKLYGTKNITDECKFYEKMVNNRYFTYQIVPSWKKKKKPMFVGFDKKGKAKRGNRIRSTNNGALFAKLDAPVLKKKQKNKRKKSS